jgi:hypothetical protein
MAKLLKLTKSNFLALGVLSLLLFIPLYPKFPLFNVPGTYVAVRIEDLWIAAILLVWLLSEIKNGLPTFREKSARLILLYFLAGGLSLVSALAIAKVITPHLALLHFLRRIQYMSLFFLSFAAIKSRRNLRSFAVALLLATFGVFIFGLGQKYFNWPVVSTMNAEFSKGLTLYLSQWTRINSTFAGHYDLAAFVVLTFTLFLGFIIGAPEKRLKIWGLLSALALFYLLLLTASRISFGAYLLATILILILAKRKKWIIPLVTLSLTAMILSGDLGQRFAATFNVDLGFLSSRILPRRERVALVPTLTPTPTLTPQGPSAVGSVSGPSRPSPTKKPIKIATGAAQFPAPEAVEMATQRSGEIRFKVEWPRALRAFAKNPILGTGYSSVTLATDNDYLRALAETGLLGFLALSLIFLEIGRKFVIFLKKSQPSFEKALIIGIAGGAVGFLANALFIDVFEASKVAFVFWILLGAMVGTINKIVINNK